MKSNHNDNDLKQKRLQKIEQSEQHHRQIVETAQEGIWMIDKNNLTTFVNKKLCEILEYTEAEMIGKENTFFMDEEGKEIGAKAKKTRIPGMSEKVDIPLVTKSGKKVWTTLTGSVILDENGQYNGGLAMVADISERKKAEEKLFQSKELFRALIENTHDAIVMYDKDLITLYRSPSATRMMGYNNEDRLGKKFSAEMHEDDAEKMERHIAEVLEKPGEAVSFTVRTKHKAGHYIWIEGITTNLLHNKNVNAIVSNLRDITQHKITENLTRRNESLLAEAQHIAKYGNWNLDVVSGHITWSEELYNVFGINRKPFNETYSSFVEIIDEEDREFVLQTSLYTQLTGEPFDIEYRITTSTGEKRVIHDIGFAEYNTSGKVVRLYGTAQNITERKKAEEELKKEKNLSDSIINSLTGIFYLLDSKGNFLRWNKNVEDLLGYSGEEIRKMNAMDIFADDEKELIAKKIEEVFSTGKAEAEAYLFNKNGDKAPYYLRATAADFDDKPSMIGMAIDISERKKAEAVIKESEAKFRAFFENSMDAILFTETDGQVLEANPAAKEIFGITENDICTMKAAKYIDTSDERLQRLLAELNNTGRGKSELTMLRKDGTKFPCEIAAVVYKDAFKEQRVSKIIRDITERKIAEERLLQINERYKLATKATSNAIWDWNIVTGETYWSEGYETFGYNPGDNSENFKSWTAKIYAPDFERVYNSLLKVVSGNDGDYWENEYRFVKADGSIAYVFNRGNLVYDKENKPTRFVGAMQDITSRKETETERELLIKELMKSNADLKQFSYITSHNIRAPLSNIMAILNMIDYPALDNFNRELITMLRTSSQQLSTTIDDLTNILVIKNSIHIDNNSIIIEDTFDAIKKTFATELENVGGKIFTDFRVKELVSYKSYLESIFINLISNAIKYRLPDRNLIINITTREDENSNCILTFSDNGIGIDMRRHRSKVFGLYQRFHSNIEGHGLGLFIIKSQIIALGGNIEIESEVGKGTSFIITFKKHV